MQTEDEQLPTLYNGFSAADIGHWWNKHPEFHVAGDGVVYVKNDPSDPTRAEQDYHTTLEVYLTLHGVFPKK